MSVYQCVNNVHLLYGYERYNLIEGQLLVANEKKLISYLDKHPNFREVSDDALVKLAPPLHMIKQPEDPYRMRKEDMINELRSYGIRVDPYDFCQKLSMQLDMARKVLKRNFVTVLNTLGYPVYIDKLKLPTLVINQIDEELTEPNDPEGEFFSVEDKENLPLVQQVEPIKKSNVEKEAKLPENVAMSIDPVYDEKEINEGVDYIDFMKDLAKKQYKAPEVERALTPIVLESQEEKEEEKEKEYTFESVNDFKYLLETQDRSFMLNEIEEEEKEKLKVVKWTKINIDVFEMILRYYGIKVEYKTEKGENKRWTVNYAVKELYESKSGYEQTKLAHEINISQLRHNELNELEPSFRNSKHLWLKRKCTDLGKYGLNVGYDKNTNIKTYARKAFLFAKMGLQIPETDEKIDEKLREFNRASFI